MGSSVPNRDAHLNPPEMRLRTTRPRLSSSDVGIGGLTFMGGRGSRRLPGALTAALAALGVYLALLNNFLRFHGYPLLRLEVLYTVLCGVVVSILFGLLYWLASVLPVLPRRIAQAVLTAGLLFYAVSLLYPASYAWMAVAGGAAAGLILLFDLQLLGPIALMAFISLVVASFGIGQQVDTLYDQSGAAKPSVEQKPAIVHIILDEHIGVEGLAREKWNDEIRSRLNKFYTDNGFKLFGGAYSDYYNTANSIPFTLSFGREEPVGAFFSSAKGNEYFRLLRKSGYRINVLQSEYIHYCPDPLVDRCTTYNSAYYGSVADTSLNAGDKAVIIAKKMVPDIVVKAASKAYLRLYDAGHGLPVPIPSTNLNPTSINGLAALQRAEHDIRDLQPGQVYFAHILLPHMPYALRPDCSPAPIREWRERVRSQSLAERQQAYARQLACTTEQIASVLRSVDRSPAGRNSIIVIHGDHGSRITRFEPLLENVGRFNEADLIAGYSTLFAVRAPGVAPGYDPRHYRLVDLLHELAVSGFRSTGSKPAADPTVVLVDKKMIPRRRIPLPLTW